MSTQRELKFRVWDATNGVMTSAPEGYMFPGDCLANDHEGVRPSLFKRRELVFLQYTGLRDKEGREIYEGDVVEAKSWHPMRYQVEFIEGGFCFTNKRALSASPIDINMMFSSQGCACSVIGTIHENPELIPA